MAIMVVTGQRGHGKGVYSMYYLEQAFKSGRPVFTNIQLRPSCPFYDRVALIGTDEWPIYRGMPGIHGKRPSDDYLAFWHYVPNDAVVVIDEAGAYFDCTDHSRMGLDVVQWLNMVRKIQMDVVFVIQKMQNLYVRIRRAADRIVVCEWTFKSMPSLQSIANLWSKETALRLSRFIRSEFDDEKFTKQHYLGSGYLSYRDASRYFNWYFTDQLFGAFASKRDLMLRELYGQSKSVDGATGSGVVVGRDDSDGRAASVSQVLDFGRSGDAGGVSGVQAFALG